MRTKTKEREPGGTVTVNGGTVTVTGGYNGAGIGGGTVTINGGTVTANGGNNAAGIGGGIEGAGGSVTINGGSVTAVGTGAAAGIGQGAFGSGGTVVLNGGTVSANSADTGPGIGGKVTLGADVTVWVSDSEDPKTTGTVAFDFAKNHSQRYVYATSEKPEIKGADLMLDGAMKLRVYVSVPDVFVNDSASMDFVIHNRVSTQSLSEAERIDGLYAFTCPVYAIEMAEPVEAYFYSSGNSPAEVTVSVRQYLDMVEAYMDKLNLSKEDTAKLRELLTAVRNYGHYMQTYLADIHGFTVGEGEGFDYQRMHEGSRITALTELPEYRRTWGPNHYDPNVIAVIRYYDDFKESTTLNIDLGLTSRPASLTATVDGKAWSVQTVDDNTLRISIPDIAANKLGKAFHVELTADGKIVYDAYLSALSYVSAVLDAHRDNENEAKALTAFYQYYQAAKAFE